MITLWGGKHKLSPILWSLFVILWPPSIHHPFFWCNTLTFFWELKLSPALYKGGLCDLEVARQCTAVPLICSTIDTITNQDQRETVRSLVGASSSLNWHLQRCRLNVWQLSFSHIGKPAWKLSCHRRHRIKRWRETGPQRNPLSPYRQPYPKTSFTLGLFRHLSQQFWSQVWLSFLALATKKSPN